MFCLFSRLPHGIRAVLRSNPPRGDVSSFTPDAVGSALLTLEVTAQYPAQTDPSDPSRTSALTVAGSPHRQVTTTARVGGSPPDGKAAPHPGAANTQLHG